MIRLPLLTINRRTTFDSPSPLRALTHREYLTCVDGMSVASHARVLITDRYWRHSNFQGYQHFINIIKQLSSKIPELFIWH